MGHETIGPPKENAIWALKVFKHNFYDVVIFSVRSEIGIIREWCETYAPGLVTYINGHPENVRLGLNPGKPLADFYIDDRSWDRVGEDLDWIVVIDTLFKKNLLPEGVLPRDA